MRDLNVAYSHFGWPMPLLATDRLDLLKLFLRAAETEQISEAARALGLSQPTASRSLKRLELLLGLRLFDRSPQGLRLTQGGRDFLAPAQRLIEDWQAAVDTVKTGKDSISGTLRVAAPVAAGQGFLAAIAADFLRAHPDIAIEWHLRDDALDVSSGGYDLWIRAGELHRDDLVVRHIYRVERALVAAPGQPEAVHPRELQARPAVRLSTFVPGTVELTDMSGVTFRLRQRTVFTTENLYAARTAVLQGAGYAVLPLWCMHAQLVQGMLVRVCDPWRPPAITFSLAYAPSRGRLPRVAKLIEHMQRELQDDKGLGVAFIREAGATDSIKRLGHRPRR